MDKSPKLGFRPIFCLAFSRVPCLEIKAQVIQNKVIQTFRESQEHTRQVLDTMCNQTKTKFSKSSQFLGEGKQGGCH